MLRIQPNFNNFATGKRNKNNTSNPNKITFGFHPYFLRGAASEKLQPDVGILLRRVVQILGEGENLFSHDTSVKLLNKKRRNGPYILVLKNDEQDDVISLFSNFIASRLSPKTAKSYHDGDLNLKVQNALNGLIMEKNI